MSGYIIYAFNEIKQTDEVYEINDIECTVDNLLCNIIKTKFKEVWFGDMLLSKHRKKMLADIGLGSECKIIIKKRQYTKTEKYIISIYSETALIAYKKYYNEEDLETLHNNFKHKYFGYYSNIDLMINSFMEFYEGILPSCFKTIDNKPSKDLIITEFIVQDNFYFWAS